MSKSLRLFSFLILLTGFVSAQNSFWIRGKVTDKNGDPLIGANVVVKELKTGASTDLEGNYNIEIPLAKVKRKSVDLAVSFVGYKTKNVAVELTDVNSKQNFTLEEDLFQNEEVVVTGIASKTSKSVAEVSVGRIAASDLQQVNSYGGLSQLVGGKISGVQLQTSSGNIGSGWRFWVRGGGGLNGDGQPIIYMDGVRLDNSEVIGFAAGGQGNSILSNLNANDIDKLEILKGPAAASSYGANGANGVILITTKKGKLLAGVSQPINIEYRYNYGFNDKLVSYSKDDYLSADDANAKFVTGLIRENFISASGGNPTLKYYTSFENRLEGGILPNSDGNRTSLRLNLTAYPTDKITLKATTGYVLNKLGRTSNDNIIYGYFGNTIFKPVSYSWVKEADLDKIKDQATINEFIGSVSATYKPITNLELNGSIGIEQSDYYQERFFPYGVDFASLIKNGQKNIYNRKNKQFTFDFNAAYSYSIFDFINVRSSVGAQFFTRTLSSTNITGEQFNTDLIVALGAASSITGYGESFSDIKDGGIFTEHTFDYLDQYYLTLGLRKDYATSIGDNAPSILYPKASFALRLDKYDFIPDYFGLLKFRIAYGESGQLPGSTSAIPLLWSAETGGYGAGAVVNSIGNDALEPERIKEIEIGLDAELFNDVSLELTYFRQNAVNSIVGKINAPSTGQTATSQPQNVGAVKNWGIESLIQYTPIRSSQYELNLSLIWNYQKNEVTDLGGAQPIYYGFNSVETIQTGLPRYEFYTTTTVGAKYDAAGKYTGAIASTDKSDIGSSVPNHTGSFSINFRFLKNFSLFALAEWGLNYKIYNYTKSFATRYGNNPEYNKLNYQLGRTELAPNTAPKGVTQLTPGTAEYKEAAEKFARLDWNIYSNYIEDANYLIIRELSLSYDLSDLLREINFNTVVKNASVGVSVRNLARITEYSGQDVELNSTGSRSDARAIDFGTLQTPRTINIWARLGF
jgi:TonB-dependent starch-binding outer membrane protein SusC